MLIVIILTVKMIVIHMKKIIINKNTSAWGKKHWKKLKKSCLSILNIIRPYIYTHIN